jgi:hypothetical protein
MPRSHPGHIRPGLALGRDIPRTHNPSRGGSTPPRPIPRFRLCDAECGSARRVAGARASAAFRWLPPVATGFSPVKVSFGSHRRGHELGA